MTLSTFVPSSLLCGHGGVEPDLLRSSYLQPGDIVAVNNGAAGRREGLVVGSHIDHLVRCNTFAPCQFPPTNELLLSLGSSNHRGSIRHSSRQLLVNPPIPSVKPTTIDASVRYPQVTRVKRTVSYAQPVRPAYRTVERRIVW